LERDGRHLIATGEGKLATRRSPISKGKLRDNGKKKGRGVAAGEVRGAIFFALGGDLRQNHLEDGRGGGGGENREREGGRGWGY